MQYLHLHSLKQVHLSYHGERWEEFSVHIVNNF